MLELIFVTSNNEKLAHARHICAGYPVKISKKKYYGVGYLEPRIKNRKRLIEESVDDAIARFNKNVANAEEKFFFIEDTSIKIHALSKKTEYPGVDVKYWMRDTSFAKIDKQLKDDHNDRRVSVRSDVVLILNKSLREKLNKKYIIFKSSVDGTIVDKEINIKTQPLYPWLNDKTFNKWFVPDGANKPLSALPIAEADKFDFRSGAFKKMLTFLKEHRYLKNYPKYKQLELFEPCVFLICGPTCAGKTSLSVNLQKKFHYYHIEASDFMHLSFYETHGLTSTVPIGDFALKALKLNPSIVVDQIINNIKNLKHIPLVITGFRSPKEVESFSQKYLGSLDIEVVFINADQNIRYERSLKRNRADAQKTLDQFKSKDAQQEKMGILDIKALQADSIIANESSFEEFFDEFENLYDSKLNSIADNFNYFKKSSLSNRDLQEVIIRALYQSDDTTYYSTTEIAHLIASAKFVLPKKSKNNVSRYFNQNFHPFYDIQMREDGIATYKLSQTGLSYGNWLNQFNLDGVENI